MSTVLGTLLLAVILLGVASVVARIAPSLVRARGDNGDRPARLQPVADTAALDPLFVVTRADPTILFLHDPGCPISRAAHRQIVRLDADIPLIDVRGARALTQAVEQRTGVRHESPQAIVLRGGRAVWSASHGAITTQAVAEALRQARGEMSGGSR